MKTVTKYAIALIAGSIGVITSVNAATDQTINYKNQRGSVMTLTWHAIKNNTGTLSGTFTTAVGNCKANVGVPMPLTGFYNGNAVAITVNFPECKQVVAMTGNLINNNNELNTIWLDASHTKDPVQTNWNSNIIGTDQYQRITG